MISVLPASDSDTVVTVKEAVLPGLYHGAK